LWWTKYSWDMFLRVLSFLLSLVIACRLGTVQMVADIPTELTAPHTKRSCVAVATLQFICADTGHNATSQIVIAFSIDLVLPFAL
jgi:hypothetical protein